MLFKRSNLIGIPYAEPPVAQARWKQSVPAQPWNNTKVKMHFGKRLRWDWPLRANDFVQWLGSIYIITIMMLIYYLWKHNSTIYYARLYLHFLNRKHWIASNDYEEFVSWSRYGNSIITPTMFIKVVQEFAASCPQSCVGDTPGFWY